MDWLSQNWIWIVLAFVVLLVIRRGGLAGCGIGHAHDHGSTTSRGEGSSAGTADPINGKPVDKEHALTSFYGGRLYYFESAESRQRFEASPERYARAAVNDSAPAAHRHRGC